MGSLIDSIQNKASKQNAMLAYFMKKSSGSVNFISVKVDRKTDVDKSDKGIIKPHINYIEDEDGNTNR